MEGRRRLNVTDNIMQPIMRRKLGLFGHICRIDNSWEIKSAMTGMMEATGRKGRPRREGIEDIEDGCAVRPMYTVQHRSPKIVWWQVQWTTTDKKKKGEDDDYPFAATFIELIQ